MPMLRITATTIASLAAVAALARADDRADALANAQRWAHIVREEIHALDEGKETTMIEKFAKNCHAVMAEAKAAGVTDDTPVTVGMYGAPDWTGSFGQLDATWCGAADARYAKYRHDQLGPYIDAGIANDKLDMIEEIYPEPYYLPGGDGTTDPKRLAKAKVWFFDQPSGEACGLHKHDDDVDVRETHVLHRYQFDAKGTLVKESSKTYCGEPPAKAYR